MQPLAYVKGSHLRNEDGEEDLLQEAAFGGVHPGVRIVGATYVP